LDRVGISHIVLTVANYWKRFQFPCKIEPSRIDRQCPKKQYLAH